MWGGEVHTGIVGDQRELDTFVGHPCTEDVAVRRVRPERLMVGLAQRTFPHDQLLADPPVARRRFGRLGKVGDYARHVLPGGHAQQPVLMSNVAVVL